MAKQSKGQKYGRNSRAPNSAMQKHRTERNKRFNVERAARRPDGTNAPAPTHAGQKMEELFIKNGSRPRHVPKARKYQEACFRLHVLRQRRIRMQLQVRALP